MISASNKGMHIVLYLIMTDTCVEVQYVKSYCVLELERGGGGYIHAYPYEQMYAKSKFDTTNLQCMREILLYRNHFHDFS